ncbi:MAG: outer membrane protein transport protein [Bryobacteraceae bacterium]|nr:outer membrane protein transport protein [Bryobacteraceae bacterium]
MASIMASLAIFPAAAHANGFDLPDHDAFAVGRGMAFVATADNPSAVYYNPAGLTQLSGHEVRAGLYGLHLDVSFESPAGRSANNEREWHAIPQLFYSYTPEKFPIAFGLGAYSPFGLSSEWPEDTGFRTVATKADLRYWTLSPVAAWRIMPSLSVAAGLTLNYSETDLRQGLTPLPGNDEFRFEGDGTDVGFNLGVLWRVHPKVQFGATYRSQTTVDFEGSTKARLPGLAAEVDAVAEFPFPQKAIVGVSYRPTPAWNLEVNVDWTDWSRLNTVWIKQETPPLPFIPANVPLVLDWESSFYYEFGATRYFENGWGISAGYIYNENSVPDATYSPLVADLDRHVLSLGVSHRAGRLQFDAAYQFVYGPTREVEGSALTAAGESADGKYEFFSHAFSVSMGWRF